VILEWATGLAGPAVADVGVMVFPSPAFDHVRIVADAARFAVDICSMSGALVVAHANVGSGEPLDISLLPDGICAVRLLDGRNRQMGVRRFVKRR
jgi:hypothetical protein